MFLSKKINKFSSENRSGMCCYAMEDTLADLRLTFVCLPCFALSFGYDLDKLVRCSTPIGQIDIKRFSRALLYDLAFQSHRNRNFYLTHGMFVFFFSSCLLNIDVMFQKEKEKRKSNLDALDTQKESNDRIKETYQNVKPYSSIFAILQSYYMHSQMHS